MVGAAVLAVPATASAHQYKAVAGPPAPPPKSAPKQTSLNRYFPSALRVRAGDSVRYKVNIAHTVTVLAKGAQAPPLAVPDPTGATITPMTDAAGQPFFFNGLPKILQNAAVFAPSGKPVIRGNATFNSGIVIGGVGNDTPTLKFAKAGSYTVLCLLHPGMEQKVTVLKKKAKVKADTDKAVRRTIAKQGVASYARATRASKKPVPANTVMA